LLAPDLQQKVHRTVAQKRTSQWAP
jgi:hypothetical protein